SVSRLNDQAAILDWQVIPSRAVILFGAVGRNGTPRITELRMVEPVSPGRTVDRAASSVRKVPLRMRSAFGYDARSLRCLAQPTYVLLATDWRREVGENPLI